MRSFRFADYGAPLQEMTETNPVPTGGDVLVRITGCGVCHSDLHLWDGHFDMGGGNKIDVTKGRNLPFTLGHEIVGVVEAMGTDASGCAVGDKAVVYPWIGCGDCPVCAAGMEHACPKPRQLGVQVDGGYADHVMVPDARYLYPYGDVDDAVACTYACSGLTAYSALKKIQAKAEGRNLLIIGAGGVGFAGMMIAQAMLDTTMIVADIDPTKLEMAKEAGADHVINPADEGARKELGKLTGGGAVAAIDFVGSDKSCGFGISALAPLGTLVVVGLFGGAVPLSVPLLPLKSLTLQGSFVGSPAEMAELMQLVRDNKIKPLPVQRRPLDQADQTLRDLRDGKVVGRVVLAAE